MKSQFFIRHRDTYIHGDLGMCRDVRIHIICGTSNIRSTSRSSWAPNFSNKLCIRENICIVESFVTAAVSFHHPPPFYYYHHHHQIWASVFCPLLPCTASCDSTQEGVINELNFTLNRILRSREQKLKSKGYPSGLEIIIRKRNKLQFEMRVCGGGVGDSVVKLIREQYLITSH